MSNETRSILDSPAERTQKKLSPVHTKNGREKEKEIVDVVKRYALTPKRKNLQRVLIAYVF